MPWMREMWLLEEHTNWNRHSTGSCLSTLAPAEPSSRLPPLQRILRNKVDSLHVHASADHTSASVDGMLCAPH